MDYIKRTIELAKENVEHGGRPFACLIVLNDKILAEAPNTVAQTNDPTSHAEINAIRIATAKLGTEHLYNCDFYILAHPCPMCLAAMYYCSPRKVFFITARDEYKPYYIDDRKYFTLENFYQEINKPWQQRAMPMEYCPHPEGIEVYKLYKKLHSKT